MPVIQLTPSVYSVGVLNPNMRVFDIVMHTEYGTTYNAYLIRGEKNVLVETCHASFFDEYVENIESILPLSQIDYIILNHTEPDHSGSLRMLLERCPQAKLFASQAASIYLKNITNRTDLPITVVKDRDTLDLGDKTLHFISAPFLHWPDTIFTYLPSERVVFTCDFLGSHYCEPRMVDAHISYFKAYWKAMEGYYAAIFGPFPKYVLAGLDKLDQIAHDTVCTSHGPVLTQSGYLPAVKEYYRRMSTPLPKETVEIPIFYTSAYGYTAQLAQAMEEGIHRVLPKAKVNLYNLIEQDMAQMGALLNDSDAFMIGSPTLNRDAVPPTWQLLSQVDAINSAKKPCAAFGSYGWSGEAVPSICQRLATLRFNVFEQGYRINFCPSEEELEKAREFAVAFARSIG